MRHLILLLPILFNTAYLQAQSSAIGRLNAAFDGRVRFSIDGDELTVDHYQGGAHVRQDITYLEFLDSSSVTYVEEEAAVVVKCLAEQESCIQKEVFKTERITGTGRMTLSMPAGDPARGEAMAALRQLIAGEQERIVHHERATNTKPRRKN